MKLIAVLVIFLSSLVAQADIEDLKCTGKDRDGRRLTVLWDGWADNRGTARVDLTIDVEGVGSRTTVDLHTYISDDGGFDYGVTAPGGEFMLHLVYPYGVSKPKEVRGDFYYGRRFSLSSRVFLSCKPVKLPKKW